MDELIKGRDLSGDYLLIVFHEDGSYSMFLLLFIDYLWFSFTLTIFTIDVKLSSSYYCCYWLFNCCYCYCLFDCYLLSFSWLSSSLLFKISLLETFSSLISFEETVYTLLPYLYILLSYFYNDTCDLLYTFPELLNWLLFNMDLLDFDILLFPAL